MRVGSDRVSDADRPRVQKFEGRLISDDKIIAWD